MTTKSCICCELERPLSDFYAHKAMSDGHLNKCKQCVKEYQHARRHVTSRDAVLAYERARAGQPHRIALRARTVSQWSDANPDKRAAHTKLKRAIKTGVVHKWPVCSVPSCSESKVVGHHSDYSRPLDVVWLCPSHHKQAHALFTRLKQGGK